MEIGIHVPQWGADATRAGVLAVARTAEDAGLDSIWVADHLVYPTTTESVYPYRTDGAPYGPEDGFLEALTTLAVVAGATERVKVGTSVFVMTIRRPLEIAKNVATLDVLSGGRVLLGVGAGWWKEEFAALAEPFAGRGRRFEEEIGIARALWRDGRLAHHGEFYDFAEVICEPLPLQRGGPPLLIGGMSPVGRERAARLGDGWHAVGSNAETLAEGMAEVRRIAAEAGRDPDELMLSTSAGLPADPDRAIDRLVRLDGAGVGHVVLNVAADTAREICAAIERLASDVLPEVRRILAGRTVIDTTTGGAP